MNTFTKDYATESKKKFFADIKAQRALEEKRMKKVKKRLDKEKYHVTLYI
jgi:hypothetical protein